VSTDKRNVTVWRPSACQSVQSFYNINRAHINMTHPGAARDAVDVHFRPSITTMDITVCISHGLTKYKLQNAGMNNDEEVLFFAPKGIQS